MELNQTETLKNSPNPAANIGPVLVDVFFLFVAASQTVHLFLSWLIDGTAWIYSIEKNIFDIPSTLCRGKDLNSSQLACANLWGLNSGPHNQLS